MFRCVLFPVGKSPQLRLRDECPASRQQCLPSRSFEADWNWILEPWGTATRAEESKSVLALVGRVDGGLVWQADQAGEKVNRGVNRLSKRAT